MRRHISVLMLYVRSTLYPVLAVLLLTAAAELIGFRLLGCDQAGSFGEGYRIPLQTVFSAAYVLTVCFCCGSVRKTVKTGYTLQRLRISEIWVFVWHSVSNICMLALLWMTQVFVVLLLARQFAAGENYMQGAQGMFIDFYRTEILHGLLPLDEVSLWVRNGLCLLASGTAIAYGTLRARYGKFPLALQIVTALTLRTFPAPIGSGTEGGLIVSIVMFFAVIVCVVGAVLTANNGEGREYDDF